jgi:hypothetical protein
MAANEMIQRMVPARFQPVTLVITGAIPIALIPNSEVKKTSFCAEGFG